MTEYCRESEIVTVYHIGAPKYPLKKTQKYTENRSEMQCSVTEVWVLEAFNRLKCGEESCDSLMLTECLRRLKSPRKGTQIEAVGILKQAMDKEDKYLIYKINNSQLKGQPDYIFKSSAPMVQLAIDMDQDGQEHPLQGEEAHFDGCHSRCAGYKALALFVYHTAMYHILTLATIEAKCESTHERTIFWELFNEILSDIKGRNYKFNPRAIMVDENSVN